MAAFMALALLTVVRSRRMSPALGAMPYGAGGQPNVPPGTIGEVRAPLAPIGSVYAAGEEWSARTAAGQLPRGTRVRVIRQEALTLLVEPSDRTGSDT
jgi:membrane-bound ClpP family serine protease